MVEDVCKPYYKGVWKTTKRVCGELVSAIFICPVSYLLRTPLNYVVKHSDEYKEKVGKIENLENEKSGLIEKIHEETRLREEACFDSTKKQGEIDKLKRELSYEQERASNLEIDLIKTIPDARKLLLEAQQICREIKTPAEVIETRAELNKSRHDDYAKWRESELAPYKKRTELAEKEAVALRSFSNKAKNIPLFEKLNNDRVPFAYYNFGSKNLYYTKATLKFFDFDQDYYENFSLSKLLRCIRKEDLEDTEERRGILYSLRKGVRLNHYKAKTSGKNPKELILTTYPFVYDNRPVGIAMFLHDTKLSLSAIKFRIYCKSFEKNFEELSKEFKEIKMNLRKDTRT
ncbi:MAG: hypothetical protein PHH54_00565 [Candidatus Nanoarchaeia archaeon]|nr:hypothetical protein [Candidatus Nanoarchaeia archaeon]MDD5740455.1 hypothetical protein [Candidatus Nanoarchaeia archaeon]